MSGQFPDLIALGALLIALSLLPFLVVLATSYTKLVVVLGLLRMALGLQQTPPNIVINGIALVLTAFIMAPVGFKLHEVATTRGTTAETRLTFNEMSGIVSDAMPVLTQFLDRNTAPRDKQFFMQAATRLWPREYVDQVKPDHLLIILPAFTISELTEAFQIGFLIYIVFVIVDLVVGTVLLSMGMMMISPTIVALPFKLLLFVALEGWSRLIQGMVTTYAL